MALKNNSAKKAPIAKLALAAAVLLSQGITVQCQISQTFDQTSLYSGQTKNAAWRFEIFQGLVISNGSFSTSIVPTICECKRRCFSLLMCKAWSVDTIAEGKECRLADHYPETNLQDSSIFGVYVEGAPAYTTSTTPPPTTTTLDPTSYELRFFEDSGCSAGRVISAISLSPGSSDKTYVKNIVCFKAKISPSFGLDNNDVQTVSTGPDNPSEMCDNNRVLVDFESYEIYLAATSTYATDLGTYDNPPHLLGVCHLLTGWLIDTNNCVTLTPTAGSWTGQVDSGANTDSWDYWMSCDPFYLAVQVTRELQGSDVRAIVSMKCCKIVPMM